MVDLDLLSEGTVGDDACDLDDDICLDVQS